MPSYFFRREKFTKCFFLSPRNPCLLGPAAQGGNCWLFLFTLPLHATTLKLYGHRGARGLSPENTIPAYKTGLAVGIDVVDMDVNMTKDGVVVVTHNFGLNPDITRTPDGK